MPIDLVCGMEVDEDAESTIFEGKTYYFCSEECLQKFQADPELYVEEPREREDEERTGG